MKTIFISSFHALISRNILETSILKALIEKGVRVVLIVPIAKKEYFQNEFGGEQVIVEGVFVPKKYFEDFFNLISLALVGIENHIVRGWKTDKRYVKYYGAFAINVLFSRFFLFHKILRYFAKTCFGSDVFQVFFERYKPDLVFTTDSFAREDRILLTESKRSGIRTLGMVRSWDNATTKGVFLEKPDHVIVTNGVLKEEMIALHRIAGEKITISGVPHYDGVLGPRTTSREQFFSDLGLDPKKKTILFAPGGKILYKHDAEILALLKRLADERRFHEPIQFLVRIPPGDRIDASPVNGDKNFIIDDPGTNVTGRKKESELSQNDNDRLNNSIFYSDIVLTLVSTMAIDGSVFGKPVVVFGFDPQKDLVDKIEKFAKYKHFEKFLGTGLVTACYSEDEFVKQTNEFLADPDANKESREELIKRYAYAIDGKSSDRVVECIFSFLR